MVDSTRRQDALLDAAVGLLLSRGYDKLTMVDVAEAADLSRTIVYRHFASKRELVDAVAERALSDYAVRWRRGLHDEPRPGTPASIYRAGFRVVARDPLLTAIATRDRDVFGRYLRDPQATMPGPAGPGFLGDFLALQQRAGVIRDGVDLASVAIVLEALTAAIMTAIQEHQDRPESPSPEALIDTVTEMIDRMLTPDEPDTAAAMALLDGLLNQR
ncbi:TetR/AcrR family transcriptional regulator [Promicromonospora sp. MEB111]|uniref:TetR/AcrR family transcriptional regulator n=1 Tax=unclassified Promicromonospora TaxID=2647929 RepID=UPI00254E9366|nr:TetR/AcrR family transcriptional regulator [Promicromonospora sp. MEB111]